MFALHCADITFGLRTSSSSLVGRQNLPHLRRGPPAGSQHPGILRGGSDDFDTCYQHIPSNHTSPALERFLLVSGSEVQDSMGLWYRGDRYSQLCDV